MKIAWFVLACIALVSALTIVGAPSLRCETIQQGHWMDGHCYVGDYSS